MGRRRFPAMPQTVREAPGQKFKVMCRYGNHVGLNPWTLVPMPKDTPGIWRQAFGLENPEAERVREYWATEKMTGLFAYRVFPQEEDPNEGQALA